MRNVAHAFRIFSRSPGFAALAAVTLALGIGSGAAGFSVVDGALLRPLPYRDPARVVSILHASVREKELAKIFASYRDLEEYAAHAKPLGRIGAATWATRPNAVLTGGGRARGYLTIPVSGDFFGTLGVPAALGRTFTPAGRGAGCAVVLSHAFWRDELNADRSVIGTSLSLDDHACRVTGVMPAAFAF